jgi:hypothetical protein
VLKLQNQNVIWLNRVNWAFLLASSVEEKAGVKYAPTKVVSIVILSGLPDAANEVLCHKEERLILILGERQRTADAFSGRPCCARDLPLSPEDRAVVANFSKP